MKTQIALLVAMSGLALLPLSVEAEIYQCDGKWTNLPCDGSIQKTLPESSSIKVDDEEAEGDEKAPAEEAKESSSSVLEPLAPRYSIVRKLKKTNRDFFLKHKITLTKDELHNFEVRCMKRETPLDECQSQYDDFVQRLNSQIKKP